MIDADDGRTTMRKYFMPLNYILKKGQNGKNYVMYKIFKNHRDDFLVRGAFD